MHIHVDTKEFYTKLEVVGRVSTKHVTLPVLQCVLLEVNENILTMRATNLEIGIEVQLPVEVVAVGSIAVPAQVLIQTVNCYTSPKITLKVADGSLEVSGGGSQTRIKSIPHEEFPTIPKINEKGQVLNRDMFVLGVKTVVFAASQSSIKPELGSVYMFQKKEHSLTFVATDSFRLMEKTVPQKGVVLDSSVLIPFKNALEIVRAAEQAQGDPVCRINENQFSLEFEDGLYITSRLVTGSFPDYEQIIPKEYCTHATVIKNDLTQAFRKTSIFLNKFLQVSLRVAKGQVILSAQSGDVGDTTEVVHAQVDGDELTLSFNQRYVAEALQHFVDDSLTMHFAGIGRPLVIKGANDSSIRYLVMPMNK